MSCGIGHRHGSDPELLWLWCRPVATTPIRPLAWEPPHAEGAALKRHTQKKGGLLIQLHIHGVHTGPEHSICVDIYGRHE